MLTKVLTFTFPKHTAYNLRSRGHGLTLSVIPSEFMRKNFINRMLFNDN